MAKKISVKEYNKITNKKQEPKKEEKKRDKLKICSVIINVALIIVIIVLTIMYLSLKDNSVSKLEAVLNGKTSDYVMEKLEFMDNNIVFKIEGFGNYYYSYDCMKKKVGGHYYSYWAYNKDAAIGSGLKDGGC